MKEAFWGGMEGMLGGDCITTTTTTTLLRTQRRRLRHRSDYLTTLDLIPRTPMRRRKKMMTDWRVERGAVCVCCESMISLICVFVVAALYLCKSECVPEKKRVEIERSESDALAA